MRNGKPIHTRVDCGNGQGNEGSNRGEKRMMNHRQAKHPERMVAQHRPISNDEQQARTHQRRKEHEDAEVPDLIGIDAELSRRMKSQHQCEQHTRRGRSAV